MTGLTGQDGSYPAEFLLAKGYEVYGITTVHRSQFTVRMIDPIYQDPHVPNARLPHAIDTRDAARSDLGAQSHVRVSFDIPEYTGEVKELGTARLRSER